MRPLVIDDDQQRGVDALVKFASEEENWFHAFKDTWTPGDRPEYILHLNSYRCVFTCTESSDGKLYRHLSISVPADYPAPIAVFQLAAMFGFTGGQDGSGICVGPGDSWSIRVDTEAHCIVVAQEV